MTGLAKNLAEFSEMQLHYLTWRDSTLLSRNVSSLALYTVGAGSRKTSCRVRVLDEIRVHQPSGIQRGRPNIRLRMYSSRLLRGCFRTFNRSRACHRRSDRIVLRRSNGAPPTEKPAHLTGTTTQRSATGGMLKPHPVGFPDSLHQLHCCRRTGRWSMIDPSCWQKCSASQSQLRRPKLSQ